MPIDIDVENVTISANCNRTFDINDLVCNGMALLDMNGKAAKYCFDIPTGVKSKEVVVNVFGTGNVTCVGSNNPQLSIKYTKMVLKMLGCEDIIPKVKMVVMSGFVEFKDGTNIHNMIGSLMKKYSVSFDTDLMGGMIAISGKDTYTQLFANSTPVKVVSSGPDVDIVNDTVRDIYDIISGKMEIEPPREV